MNFLGHLYFSDNNHELMTANIYGDFVKGRDLSDYPKIVRKGIELHRAIDSYIDRHADILTLLRSLYEELPKVSGIAIDLYFDHLLAKHWNKFHKQDLRIFLNNYYASIGDLNYNYPLEFLVFLGTLKHGDWLWQYQTTEGLRKACTGVSKRIAFENTLHKAPAILSQYSSKIEEVFFAFMQDANEKFYTQV